MTKRKINAKIIADSTNEHGQRITTFVLTYPRIIHAELLTHRLFSRNAASSRAIPASKMIKDIEEDPFIPVAWQKAHSGMQGTEYFEEGVETGKIFNYQKGAYESAGNEEMWRQACADAIENAKCMVDAGITKQLVNRILEPYQWYTCIVTATEYDNFFELRCPQYTFESGYVDDYVYKSRKDFLNFVPLPDNADNYKGWTDLDWLKRNKGQGEIHISLLAEAMWDARNESEPKKLKAGEWHIPFGDKFDESRINDIVGPAGHTTVEAVNKFRNEVKIEIATARCARVSYLNFEGKDDYKADRKLYDRLLEMGHCSPFEHCARAMNDIEYEAHIRSGIINSEPTIQKGWSGNFKGFVQLRKEIE